jgi:catechol 2,3-dioxygenase-like lactoylglutathione lyase family enzyme
MRLNQVTVAVRDVDSATTFYQMLGLKMIVRADHYARFLCPDGESTFSIHLSDAPIGSSTVVYFECEELDSTVRQLKATGLVFESDPKDQPWLWREAYLFDPSGNRICLFYGGKNRIDPPWRIPESRDNK